jgi:hypothetical protein
MPVTNIKFINYNDQQNLAIDKINHNFDEIVEAHGGSVGETGPTGDRGAIGNNGAIGSTGNDGPRGTRWFVQDLEPSTPFGSGNSVVYGDYWVNNNDSQIYQFGPSGWIDTGYSLSSSGNIFNDVDSYFTSGGTGISVKFNQTTPENCTFIVSDRSPESGIINQKLAKFLISTDSAGDPSALLEFMKSDIIIANPGNYALHPTFSWSSSLPTDNGLKFDVPGGSLLVGASGGFSSNSQNFDVSSGSGIDINYGVTSGSGISATGGIRISSSNPSFGAFNILSDNLSITGGHASFKSNVIVNGDPTGNFPSVDINVGGTGGLRTQRTADTFDTLSKNVYNVSLETATDREFYINTKGKIRTKKIKSGVTYQSYQSPTFSGSGQWFFISRPGGPIQSTVIRNGNTVIITSAGGIGSQNGRGIGLYDDPLYSLWGPGGIENGQSIDISVYSSPDGPLAPSIYNSVNNTLFNRIGVGTTAGVVTKVNFGQNAATAVDFTIVKGATGSTTTVYYRAYTEFGASGGSFTV